MKVVVTGGAGFIGGNLCRLLAGSDWVDEVVALDDLSTGSRSNLAGATGVPLVEGSILDVDLLEDVVRGADAIVHLAARPSVPLSLADPVASHEVNVTGTVRVLEAARRSGSHVIVASSSAVYGDSSVSLKHEELPTRPLSPYGVTKVATEEYAAAYMHSFGVPTLALRFFNVFGPLQPAGHAYAAVVPAFMAAVLSGEPLPMFGDGRQVRDFVFVTTVAEVMVDAVRRRFVWPGPVNLASGVATDLLGLAEELGAVVGHSLPIDFRPARTGDIRDSRADASLFQRSFPAIEPTPLARGLRETYEWFLSQPATA